MIGWVLAVSPEKTATYNQYNDQYNKDNTMNTCKNLIAVCSQTHLPCPHCSVSGQCSSQECVNSTIPSWTDVISIYITASKPSVNRIRSVRYCVNSLVKILDLTLESKVTLTPEQLDDALSRYRSLHRKGNTISTVFTTVGCLFSRRSREIKLEYRRRGFTIPEYDPPKVEIEKTEIDELTEDQRLKIRDEMSRLRHSPHHYDRNRFVFLWCYWKLGMRPKDICRVTWSMIFRHRNGKMWFKYIPSKTDDKTKHRPAGGQVYDDDYAEIYPYIGAPDEPVITSEMKYMAKSTYKNGNSVGTHRRLRKYANEFMKSIGAKNSYTLRKDCSAVTMSKYGMLVENQRLGHTPKVALDAYANLENLDLVA